MLCIFQLYVEGQHCDKCVPGYFGLSQSNPEGCTKCYCSGVGNVCESSNIITQPVSQARKYLHWSLLDVIHFRSHFLLVITVWNNGRLENHRYFTIIHLAPVERQRDRFLSLPNVRNVRINLLASTWSVLWQQTSKLWLKFGIYRFMGEFQRLFSY